MIAFARRSFAVLLALIAAGAGYAVLQIPASGGGLSAPVMARLSETGVGYPVDAAGTLILVIESFAMLSIAFTLHTLFAGTARVGTGQ